MSKFTIIMEYKAGTYVAQVKAGNIKAALREWSIGLDCSYVYGLGDKGKRKLIVGVAGDEPTPLAGLENVWCLFFTLPGGSALINVIRTHER